MKLIKNIMILISIQQENQEINFWMKPLGKKLLLR
jgi:hypothetical protein